MDVEFVKWLTSLGVGGSIAAILFYFYRKDVAAYTAAWRGQTELTLSVIKENTVAITTLVNKLDREHIERSNRYNDQDPRRITQLQLEIERIKAMQQHGPS